MLEELAGRDFDRLMNLMHRLAKAQQFAHLLCRMGELSTYVVVGKIDESHAAISVGGWVGRPFHGESRAPAVAYSKFGEVVWVVPSDGFALTPVPNFTLTLGWLGGARRSEWGVAVSKLAEQHDLLIAVMTLYYLMGNAIELHHVGFRHQSKEAYEAAVIAVGIDGIAPPAEDHIRSYHVEAAHGWPHGICYVEQQYFPNEPGVVSQHWDIVAHDPRAFLTFVGEAFGIKPMFWEEEENAPVGVVWIPGSDDKMYGVMARRSWWYVENSK